MENGVRAEIDEASESLGKKIRDAKTQKIPYLLVIGDKEVESKEVTVESRKGNEGSQSLKKFLENIKLEIANRK